MIPVREMEGAWEKQDEGGGGGCLESLKDQWEIHERIEVENKQDSRGALFKAELIKLLKARF